MCDGGGIDAGYQSATEGYTWISQTRYRSGDALRTCARNIGTTPSSAATERRVGARYTRLGQASARARTCVQIGQARKA